MDIEHQKRRAWLRLALGNAQMFGATVSTFLLVQHGVTSPDGLLCLAVTAVCTVTSLMFFRDWWWKH